MQIPNTTDVKLQISNNEENSLNYQAYLPSQKKPILLPYFVTFFLIRQKNHVVCTAHVLTYLLF